MAPSFRTICSTAALVLALAAAPVLAGKPDPVDHNRMLSTAHQPTVSRTDYTVDLVEGPSGLAFGEEQRLTGWFEGLNLGYGDTVTVAGSPQARDAVGSVLSHFGMLVSHDPVPDTAGVAPSNSVRVVVSRAVAHVDGCPNWSTGNNGNYGNTTASNFGCAAAQDLAAMIANPQDLVQGVSAGPDASTVVSVKSIKSWRDAKNTGDAGLPGGNQAVTVVKTSGGN